MSKKTPETPRRKPAKKTAAEAPAIAPAAILHQLRSGQPIDTTGWKGNSVEIRDGKVFVRQRVGCVDKKIINGEPLRPSLPAAAAAESAAAATPNAATELLTGDKLATLKGVEPAAVPAAPNSATTADTTATEAPAPAGTSEQPALAPAAPAPAQAQPNGNEGNGRKLPPPPPPRRGTLVAPAAAIADEPAEPSVVVPAMEAPTIVIPVVQEELIRNSNTPNEVTIFIDGTERLARKIEKLIVQADLLLRNGKLPSGADIPTIINNFEDYDQQAAALERFYLSAQLSPDQRKLAAVEQAVATVRELKGKIKEKLLALRAKQAENGEAKRQIAIIDEQSRRNKTLLTAGGAAAAIAVVLGGIVIAKKYTGYDVIAESEQPHTITSAVSPDINQTNIAPLPPETPEQPMPPAEIPAQTAPTQPEVKEQPMPPAEIPAAPTQPEPTPEPPAKKPTATFNCELDTTDQARIKCVDSNAPDAEVTEDLAWGEYNSETQTVPAKVTLTTPDGKQFTAQFDAQIGTRQELSWTLEATSQ